MKIASKAHFKHNPIVFKYSHGWLVLPVLIGKIIIINYFFPQAYNTMSLYQSALQNGEYVQVFNLLDTQSQSASNPNLFSKEMQETENQLKVIEKKISISTPFVYPWQQTVNATSTIVYSTELGDIATTKQIQLNRTWLGWKLHWEWDSLLAHYSPADTIEVKKSPEIIALQKKDGHRYILLYKNQ